MCSRNALAKCFRANRKRASELEKQASTLTGNKKWPNFRPNNNNNQKPTNTHAQDGNGVIENEELKGFIKDLMDFLGKVCIGPLARGNCASRWLACAPLASAQHVWPHTEAR